MIPNAFKYIQYDFALLSTFSGKEKKVQLSTTQFESKNRMYLANPTTNNDKVKVMNHTTKSGW